MIPFVLFMAIIFIIILGADHLHDSRDLGVVCKLIVGEKKEEVLQFLDETKINYNIYHEDNLYRFQIPEPRTIQLTIKNNIVRSATHNDSQVQ